MNGFEEYVTAVDQLRAEYPRRPSREQWKDFFRRAAALGVSGSNYLEAFLLEAQSAGD